MCFCVFLYSNITNPRRAVSSSQYNSVVCPLTPLPSPRSELWLVLSLICTLLTSNMTRSIYFFSTPPKVCFTGVLTEFVKERERECVRKRGENSPSPTNPTQKQKQKTKHTHTQTRGCRLDSLGGGPRCRIWDRLCFHSR